MTDRPTTHRMYYVAIVCPDEINEKVLRLKYGMKDRYGCTVALKSPAHITLIPPFWADETGEDALINTLQAFTFEMEEVEVAMDGFSHFTNRVLFVNVKNNPSLEDLKKRTEEHFIQAIGDIIKPDDRPFHPHVTIANRDLMPYAFVKAWRYFEKKSFEETFQAHTISLLKLEVGKWNVISEMNWR